MAEYSRFYKRRWDDHTKFASMSPLALSLYFFLRSCRHSNSLGIYRLHRYYALADLPGWSEERLQQGFNELFQNGWIVYDNDNYVILLTDWFQDHNCDNDNQFLRFKADLERVPNTRLFKDLITCLESKDSILKPQYSSQLVELLRQRLEIPIPQPLPEGLAKPVTVPIPVPVPDTVNGGNPPTKPQIDYQGFVDLFNEQCPTLPRVVKITDPRRDKIRQRLKEYPDWDSWRKLFARVEASNLLTGKVPGKNGADPFMAFFDWILEPKNLIKIIEGNYDNRGNGQRPGAPGKTSRPASSEDFQRHIDERGANAL